MFCVACIFAGDMVGFSLGLCGCGYLDICLTDIFVLCFRFWFEWVAEYGLWYLWFANSVVLILFSLRMWLAVCLLVWLGSLLVVYIVILLDCLNLFVLILCFDWRSVWLCGVILVSWFVTRYAVGLKCVGGYLLW